MVLQKFLLDRVEIENKYMADQDLKISKKFLTEMDIKATDKGFAIFLVSTFLDWITKNGYKIIKKK